MISWQRVFRRLGFIPIVDTFGQFGVTKGNLPLTMAALSQAPVIAMFSHVGFQDAADGASHQATTYFAAVSAIPAHGRRRSQLRGGGRGLHVPGDPPHRGRAHGGP
jgi:transketolase C-terminal domain/subunit